MSEPQPPPGHGPEDEELVHYDDAVIGKAFRISAVAAVAIVLIGGAIFMFLRRPPPPPPAKVTQIDAPVVPKFTAAAIPKVSFTEISKTAGVDFSHFNGARGRKLLPETMGGGVGFFDFDHDGDQDLLFINGKDWPDATNAPAGSHTAALYRNDGKGRFENATSGSGLDVPIYGMAPAFGDFDNDGLVDVFVTAVGDNYLFKNLGNGKFQDATRQAGVAGKSGQWSSCAAWFDFDNDGDLDLFVGNYVRWSPEIDLKVGWTLVGLGRAYGQPKDFEGAHPYLYRNEGGGRFSEISESAGVQVKNVTGIPAAKSLGVVPVDIDNDGWMDLIVANDTVPNSLFHNEKNGTFKEIGGRSGVAFDSFGATRGAMGVDVARYRDDHALGIAIGNFANEMTALYVAQPGAEILFTDEALTEGIGAPSRLPLKFGIFFFDYDLDGRLDILSANGHLEEEIAQVQKSQKYRQSAQLFWNCGPTKNGCFVSTSAEQAGEDLFHPIVGRGSAYADIDGDGDLDVVLTQTGGTPLLLRNDQTLNHHWVRLRLVGKSSNRDAIGAWIHLKAGGQEYWRAVNPTKSYFSQSELPVTIGLGSATKIDLLEIRWPGGKTQQVQAALDRETVITQD